MDSSSNLASTGPSQALQTGQATEVACAQEYSLFFQKLPAEIRQGILVAAFGNRVLHIVHWKDYRNNKKLRWSGGECRNPVLHQVERSEKGVGKCDCVGILRANGSIIDGEHDRVIEDMRVVTDNLGVMGWMLSCRRAYREAIGVLYRENTFDVRSETLRPRVTHYFPRQQMRHITAVQWRLEPGLWTMGRGPKYTPGVMSKDDHLVLLEKQLVSMLELMPSLRKFYFGFCGWGSLVFWNVVREHRPPRHWVPFKRRFQLYLKYVIPLLDLMARNLALDGRRMELEFGLPQSVFVPYFTIARGSGAVAG